MTCRSDDRQVAADQRDRRASANHGKKNCSSCNSQLCSSYVVGLLACVLIIGGVFLAFQRWDYMWLFVTLIGIILTFVGASLHYCGTRDAPKQATQRQTSATTHEVSQSEQLLSPSAPSLNGAFSASQLSLSMLPPYFPSYDTMSISGPRNGGCLGPSLSPSIIAGATGAISPIMQINGQSFLLLPIGKQISEDGTVVNDAQSIITSKTASIQMNPDPSQVLNEPSRGFIMIKPTDFQTQSVNQNTPRVPIATQSTNVGAAPINNQQSPTQIQCNSETGQNTHNTVPQNGRDVPTTTTPPTVSDFRPTFSTQLSVSQSTQTSVNDSVAVDIQTCIPNESLVTEATNTAEDTEAPFYNEIIPVLHVEPIYEVPRLLTDEAETNAIEVDGTDCRVTPPENRAQNAATATDEVRDLHATCSRLEVPVVPDVINSGDTLSRATTPDRDELDLTMCPPSYDEVAVTTRLGPLGMPKFAYETM